ncbi:MULTISPECIES: hypothetical protein [unclassified Streptomyces]|uniref:hypothetical protein n=1 Tax=unclassified Streptomyces TaxID=2593676 RepID=UPI001F0B815A|nr:MULTISPECIES: hypothetical protein [unclassified Streptomyces]
MDEPDAPAGTAATPHSDGFSPFGPMRAAGGAMSLVAVMTTGCGVDAMDGPAAKSVPAAAAIPTAEKTILLDVFMVLTNSLLLRRFGRDLAKITQMTLHLSAACVQGIRSKWLISIETCREIHAPLKVLLVPIVAVARGYG